jgi:hypothetical protein
VAAAFGALQREGLGASLDVLEHAAAEDSAVLRDGHQLAHALGRQAVAARGGDASVISECRPSFASGCYHGVVEGSLKARGHLDMGVLKRMCAAAGSDERPGPVYECVHGLGHGVLGAVGFDLGAALHYCDALGSGFDAWCHSGVFMEAITSSLGEPSRDAAAAPGSSHAGMAHAGMDRAEHASLAHQLSLDPADPYSPCDRFEDPYGAACWRYQGFVILRDHAFDPAEALRTCDEAPRGRAGSCYESIGHQLTGLFQRGDAWVIEQCARGSPDLAPHCAAGAALALAQMDWSGASAARFCEASPPQWKSACYRTTAGLLTAVASRAQRTKLCSQIESDYVKPCRRAAALDGGS